jgi:peptide subunit release factor 1 (eRF1)
MITPRFARALLAYDNPALTVYLDVNPSNPDNQGSPRAYQTWLKTALSDLDKVVPPAEHQPFCEASQRVEEYVRLGVRECRGLVVVASPDLWEVFRLPFDVANRAWWGKPAVGELLRLLLAHRPYGIVLMDHERARLLSASADDVTEVTDSIAAYDTAHWRRKIMMPPRPPGQRQAAFGVGGSNVDDFRQRVDANVQRFYGRLLTDIATLLGEHELDGFVLGGPPEPVAEFAALLPLFLQAQLVDTLQARVESPAKQAAVAAWPVVRAHRTAAEAELTRAIVDQAGSGSLAAVGLEPTLRAMAAAAADTVVVGRSWSETTCYCPACGTLGRRDQVKNLGPESACTTCGSNLLEEGLGAALDRLSNGANLLPVGGEAAELLIPFGGIGARLRFHPAAA